MKLQKKNRVAILLTYFIWSWSALLASATWWLLTVSPLKESKVVGKEDYSKVKMDYCNSLHYLTPKQSEFCNQNPTLMYKVSEGVRSGIRECQFQFRYSRWNCSIYPASSKHHAFKPIIKSPSREASYVHAIIAASISYEVTRACSSGDLPEECSCAKKGKKSRFEWSGCSDDIKFGDTISRQFLDDAVADSVQNRLKQHNSEAGRRAVRMNDRVVCKCHGLSGACTQNVCWRAMPRLRNVSGILKEKFDGAIAVKPKRSRKLRPVQKGNVKPTNSDLVYIRKRRTTDFCEPSLKQGSYGTHGRVCNETSRGTDGCGIMCCDRGHRNVNLIKKVKCNCIFEWCCKLKCQECLEESMQSICI